MPSHYQFTLLCGMSCKVLYKLWTNLLWSVFLISAYEVLAQDDFEKPRRYVLNLQPLTWEEASQYCQNNGGHLAKVYDISTIPDLQFSSNISDITNPLFWIGLSYLAHDAWVWADNTSVSWENWDEGSNIIPSGQKRCAAASDNYPCLWTVEACGKRLPSLCQYDGGECSILTYENHSIAGHNSLYLYEKTAEECAAMCLTEPTIFCVSFEHSQRERLCQFNTGNRWTHPSHFTYSDGWNYYHKTCNTGEMITSNLTVVQTTSLPVELSTSTVYNMPCTPVFDVVNVTITTTVYSIVYSTVTHIQLVSLFVNDTTDPIEELQEIQEVLKEKQKQRTKVSYDDNRPSATYVGYIAIVFVSCVFGSIVLFDLLTVCRNVNVKKKSKLRRKYDVLNSVGRKNVLGVNDGNKNTSNQNKKPSGQGPAGRGILSGSESNLITVSETNGYADAVITQRQRRLLWKQLWPGFRKLSSSQDHDIGTENDACGLK